MKAFLIALLFCVCLPVSAASLSPMAQGLSATTKTGAVQVKNDSKVERRYQIIADAMSVGPHGEKVLTPATDLTFYPSPIMTLGPGKTQTLRWKRTATDTNREQVYWIQVVPLDDGEVVEFAGGVQLKVKLGINVPWAFTPKGMTSNLSAFHEGDFLVLTNTGNAAASLSEVRYGTNGNLGVQLVLPGERLRLKVKARAAQVQVIQGGALHTLSVE